jgi:hypothetical protein
MRKSTRLCAAGLAAAVTCGAVAATASQAAIVFRDNFENVTGVSPYPDASADADPIAQVGTWTIIESAPARVQVTTDYSPFEGTRALATERTGDGASELRANLSSAVPSNPADLVTISFRYKDPTPDAQFSNTVDTIQLYGYNDTDANYDQQLFNLQIYKNWGDADDVYVAYGATGTDPTANRFADVGDPDDVWNLVSIEMNFATHQYSMTINGAAPVAGPTSVAFNGDAASANQLQQVMFYHLNSSSTRFAIDDVTVNAVPEPASATLLGLGAATALLRRRRVG